MNSASLINRVNHQASSLDPICSNSGDDLQKASQHPRTGRFGSGFAERNVESPGYCKPNYCRSMAIFETAPLTSTTLGDFSGVKYSAGMMSAFACGGGGAPPPGAPPVFVYLLMSIFC